MLNTLSIHLTSGLHFVTSSLTISTMHFEHNIAMRFFVVKHPIVKKWRDRIQMASSVPKLLIGQFDTNIHVKAQIKRLGCIISFYMVWALIKQIAIIKSSKSLFGLLLLLSCCNNMPTERDEYSSIPLGITNTS
ncbi:hypothetical protein BD560DRAFT_490722 [Blakeslea trispora]|nr:hypothetical protein BD560DRAFT_490722 [Blakeslea trispora]